MTWRSRVLRSANAILHPLGIHVMPEWEFQTMRSSYFGPDWKSPPLSESDLAYLRPSNPRLVELRQRYDGHPAAQHTQWSEANLLDGLLLEKFRGENHYVYQVRYSPSPATYFVTAYHVRDVDKLDLFGTLIEDGLYGPYTLEFNDHYQISRDLLQSINEINFICRMLGKGRGDALSLLDIGAGYGRLAHRVTEAMPSAMVTCTDAVPLSTFLSEFYLQARGCGDRARVVPLDDVEGALKQTKFDLVTNIHSFSECRSSVIEWWLRQIDQIDVANMLIVPNMQYEFRSTEPDGSHQDFLPILHQHGWKLAHREPIYGEGTVASQHGLYPNFCFHWFRRD